MYKKGQTRQIFVWIFVVVVASVILIFGFGLIKKSSNLQNDVLVSKFFNDLDKKFNQYYFLERNSEGDEKFFLPNDVEWVCLVKTLNDIPNKDFVSVEEKDLMRNILDASEQGSYVFVGPLVKYENNQFKLEKEFNGNGICKEVKNSNLVLELSNRGGVEVA